MGKESIKKSSEGQYNVSQSSCAICGTKIMLVEETDSCLSKCKDCSRKSYAVRAIIQLKEYIELDAPFKKDDLLKQVDNRMQFLDYIWTLQEMNLLDEDQNTDSYIFKSEKTINSFIEKYGDLEKRFVIEKQDKTEESIETKAKKVVKECGSCGQKLSISKFYKSSTSEDGLSDKCKDCSRKSYAAKALIELRTFTEPGVIFYKEDVLNQCENRIQFLDYLWTMQELDLLKYDENNDSYLLKDEGALDEFIDKYGDKVNSLKSSSNKIKTFKECESCGQKLPISKFYKLSSNEDGFNSKCKDCSKKNNAKQVLIEIRDLIEPGKPFTKDELLKEVTDPTKTNYYIWTLQEEDLVKYDEKNDHYILQINDKQEDYQKLMQKPSNHIKEDKSQLIVDKVKSKPMENVESNLSRDNSRKITADLKETLNKPITNNTKTKKCTVCGKTKTLRKFKNNGKNSNQCLDCQKNKVCSSCGKPEPRKFFYKNTIEKKTCKYCRESKKCLSCGKTRILREFPKTGSYYNYCSDCRVKKRCPVCNKIKPLHRFYRNFREHETCSVCYKKFKINSIPNNDSKKCPNCLKTKKRAEFIENGVEKSKCISCLEKDEDKRNKDIVKSTVNSTIPKTKKCYACLKTKKRAEFMHNGVEKSKCISCLEKDEDKRNKDIVKSTVNSTIPKTKKDEEFMQNGIEQKKCLDYIDKEKTKSQSKKQTKNNNQSTKENDNNDTLICCVVCCLSIFLIFIIGKATGG